MAETVQVQLEPQPLARYRELLGPGFEPVLEASNDARRELSGRVVWNVNSTARGGGVAEMLRAYLPYLLDSGVDTRWRVLQISDPAFFDLTKRLHNSFHGDAGDGGPLGAEQKRFYLKTLKPSGAELGELISPQDVVMLHDPQTAGLIPVLKEAGATVIWRCHIGVDESNEFTRRAEEFLHDEVMRADASIFSRRSYGWKSLPDELVHVIPPGIDAFTPKNVAMDKETRDAVLGVVGLEAGTDGAPEFTRPDGSTGRVERAGVVVQTQPLPAGAPLIMQVSRWDRLKDHGGLLTLFARDMENREAHLALVGPDSSGVDDDPEGAAVYQEIVKQLDSLPDEVRTRVHLVSLPMDDLDENAFMVNALQRRAAVIVQKSLAEGFGLTVSEGMWKSRPMVASGVGGIQDQVEDGISGILIDDPHDYGAFAKAIDGLLADPDRAAAIGEAARERVKSGLLSVQRLTLHYQLVDRLLSPAGPSGP